MYKKITHNIVEEHFDHPVALPQTLVTSSIATLPTDSMTESTMLFRMDSRVLWGKYVWDLLNYGTSLINNLPSTPVIEARVLKNADAVGDFIVPFYGLTAGKELNVLLEKVVQIGADVAKILKAGGTLNDSEKLWTDLADQLAIFLNKLNPDHWPKDAVAEYLTTLLRFWVEEMQALVKEDWKVSEAVIDNINQIFAIPTFP